MKQKVVMMTSYWAPMSTATVTEAVLAELAIDHQRIELDIDRAETREPSFLAVNPNGRVPTLVVDGEAIWESAAITIHLGETYGVAAGLYPAAGLERARALKWIVWTNTSLGEAAGRLAATLPDETPGGVQSGSVDRRVTTAAEESRARTDLADHMAVLDDALTASAYLTGPDYVLADTHCFVIVAWTALMGVELAAYPQVEAWASRCRTRPAIAPLFAA